MYIIGRLQFYVKRTWLFSSSRVELGKMSYLPDFSFLHHASLHRDGRTSGGRWHGREVSLELFSGSAPKLHWAEWNPFCDCSHLNIKWHWSLGCLSCYHLICNQIWIIFCIRLIVSGYIWIPQTALVNDFLSRSQRIFLRTKWSCGRKGRLCSWAWYWRWRFNDVPWTTLLVRPFPRKHSSIPVWPAEQLHLFICSST